LPSRCWHCRARCYGGHVRFPVQRIQP